jgi:DnaJ like chaperone protein
MSWKGKVLGGMFGFFMGGGPIGAAIGIMVGHQLDKNADGFVAIDVYKDFANKQRVQDAFFTATFSVMGHIAKVDGVVSQAEINLATRVMDEMRLSEPMRKNAIHLFQEGKRADFPLNEALAQFRRDCEGRKNLLYMFLEIQLQAAFADGEPNAKEERLLLQICQQLGISNFEYQGIKLQFQARQRFYQQRQQSQTQFQTRSSLHDAYAVLGLKSSATNSEIKTAYRRLMSQHHPDKLVAKGLPEEMMTIAKEKTQQISKAYETIKSARKI